MKQTFTQIPMTDRRNHITLVQRDYLLNTGRFRGDQRDAFAGLYGEVDDVRGEQARAIQHVEAARADAARCRESGDEKGLARAIARERYWKPLVDVLDWDFLETHLDKQLLMSQNVDGWRAEQLLQAMIGERERQERIEAGMRGQAPVQGRNHVQEAVRAQ